MKKASIRKASKLITVFVLAVAILLSVPVTVSAGGTDSYVTGDDNYRLPVPESYIVTSTINNIGDYEDDTIYFKNPLDLFVDDNDYVYVVDSGNNRIVKMNSDYETVNIFYGEDCGGFKAPEGIFVDSDGDMYLADTGNSRIVHMDPDGNFVEQFTNPESDSVDTGTSFAPSKLVVSQTGYIYVVRGENIMAIDGNGEFRGYYGQTDIGYDLVEVLTRLFASEEQQKAITKRTASAYINVTLGDDGMIYATSMERTEGEIKRLNSIGTNTYRKYTTVGNTINNPITEFIEDVFESTVAANTFKFGEYFDDNGEFMEPIFADICVDSDGIVTVIERQTGHVYQYDQDGRMLVAFGGLGEKEGTFSLPAAIDVDSDGNLLILDRSNANIQVFSPTEFIQLVHQATSAYNDGDYEGSYDLWTQVLAIDENYTLAHTGIAKSYYKQEEYQLSMEESKIVDDRDTYTLAFDEWKMEVMRAHFVEIIVIALLIIVAFCFVVSFLSRKSKQVYWDFINDRKPKMSISDGLFYGYYTMLHPVNALQGISYRKQKLNMAVPFIVAAAAFAVRVAYLYIVHFPLASIELEDVNLALEAVKLFIVPVSWIPAAFMATSISGGETKVKEITFASLITLVPFIVINLPLMFLSHILSKTQDGWYGVFGAAVVVLIFIELFVGMMEMNNYTFRKTILMMLTTAFLMLVLWLVILLCYILTGRVVQFVAALISEFRLNFL
ncbi:MAG: SMP-30/gluconolactonase/LRE family protein [Lachnospiraceae bacterium]|nr:SMP-30/gluconolactonase/LRE family protein [Lachnospiraceae bacterium]